MLRVWRLFTVATGLVGIGVTGLAVLMTQPAKPGDLGPALAVLIGAIAVLTTVSWIPRPRLGIED